MVDHLSDSTRAHYDAVRQHLTDLGVTWTEAPKLVRGLDYYTKTTFEFVHNGLGCAVGDRRRRALRRAVGGARRARTSRASATPSASTGRCWRSRPRGSTSARRPACRRSSSRWAPRPSGSRSGWSGSCARPGVAADTVYGDRGLKGAMKAAERSGASHAVVVGDRDLAEGVAQLKDMRTGEQHAVPVGRAVRDACVRRWGHDLDGTAAPRADRRRRLASSGWARGSSAATGATSTTTRPPTSSTPRSTPASPCWTPPTSTATAARRSASARRWPPRSDRPFVATKAGRRADPFEAAQYTPENLRAWIDRSRRNLGVDTLDLVQLHCPPPAVYSDQRVYDTLDALVDEEAIAAYGVSVETVAEGLTALAAPGRADASRSSSTSSGASRWRSCCRPPRRPASASSPGCRWPAAC